MTYSTGTIEGNTVEQRTWTLSRAIEEAVKRTEHDHRSRYIYDLENGDLLAVVRVNFRNKHARAIRMN